MLVKQYLIAFVLALIPLSGFANEQISKNNIQYTLEGCLFECYYIDQTSANVIVNKFNPLIENVNSHRVIRDFIEKSKSLNINFFTKETSGLLPPDDAILLAPDWHKILFESEHVRILLGYSKPGEREPFHRHQWKRIMVMIQDATFKIENADGSTEIDTWPMGVYELPPETTSSAYTNIGNTEFIALIFEVKR